MLGPSAGELAEVARQPAVPVSGPAAARPLPHRGLGHGLAPPELERALEVALGGVAVVDR
jgi:hypothetical protein